MKKLLKVLVVCLAMAMMLAGCGNGGNGGTSNEGGQTDGENSGIPTDQTLIMVTQQDPQSFNPDFKSDDGAWPINQNIFNRLVKLGNNTKINLDLAESYEFSEDGMQLTFHLHDGVKWHDGEPFTSADVKWTYDTAIAEKWSKADNLSNIDSIECPDDNTVVMNLKTPDVSIIAKLAWYGTFIMPKHLYEGTDTATNPYNQNPVGTGPFKFVEYKAGQYVTLERNEDYWGDKAIAKTLKFAIISDDNTLWEAFMNGEVDDLCQMIPAAHANDLDGNDNYTFYSEMGINRTYITFNLKDERFQDQRVREAFALAIDNQGCWDRTAGGNGEPSEYMISHAFTKYLDEDSKLPKRNVEEAMKLLEEAGYTKDADGYYMHVTLDAFESGNWKDLAAIIQQNVKEAGIDLKINMMEMAAWQDKVQVNRNFEITMLAGYQGPDISGVSGRVQTGTSMNMAGYSNPELDALLDKGVTLSNEEERIECYKEIQKIMRADLPIIPIIDNGYKYAIKKEMKGMPMELDDKTASSEYTYTYRAE